MIAFSDTEARVVKNAFGIDSNAVSMSDYSSPDSLAALKSISISIPQSKENKIKLNIERPIEPDEKLEITKNQGRDLLMKVLGRERVKLENQFQNNPYPDDKCYWGAISSGFSQTAQDFTTQSLNDLAVDITALTLGNISIESNVEDALRNFVVDVGAAYFKNDDVNIAVARSIVERTIGYILPIVADRGPDNPPEMVVNSVDRLSGYVARDVIKEEGIIAATTAGTNEKYSYRINDFVPRTHSNIKWYYSPTTHYLSAYISAQCEPDKKGLYVVRFQVEKSIVSFGRVPIDDTVKVLPLGMK